MLRGPAPDPPEGLLRSQRTGLLLVPELFTLEWGEPLALRPPAVEAAPCAGTEG